jgi:hypothetical protein
VPFEGQHISPESVGVEPACSVSDLQQAPRAGDPDAVLRGQARSAAVVGSEEAQQLTPDNDCEGLCLAEMLSRQVSWAGELIAEHANILVLSLVWEERLAKDLFCPVQRS